MSIQVKLNEFAAQILIACKVSAIINYWIVNLKNKLLNKNFIYAQNYHR